MESEPTVAIYQVSSFMQEAKTLLEGAFQWIWVTGELSNLVTPQSGHLYFTLKDQQAQVRCAFFKQAMRRLPFSPQNGQQVLIQARVSLYEPRGDFQLIVLQMQPAGEGALQLAFLQLKQKLSAEGLFDPARKKNLPPFPKTIGVITSSTGAAIRDILNVTKRRSPVTSLIIYPSLVQGTTAATQIAEAIHLANRRKEVDVLLLARGGGSLEDLWAFNEEIVARAIASSALPIVSAVGHEIDFTIADFVADLRAATPSVAAEILTPDFYALLRQFTLQFRLLQQYQIKYLKQAQQSLLHLQKRVRHPTQLLAGFSRETQSLCQRLMHSALKILQIKGQAFQHLTQQLHTVSPLNTLTRGYAIATRLDNDQILRHTSDAIVQDKIKLRLAEGELYAEIIEPPST